MKIPSNADTLYQTVDSDHGRIETRLHRVSHAVEWLFSDRRYKDEPCLPGLTTIACVHSTRQTRRVVRRLRPNHHRPNAIALKYEG